MRLDTCGVRLGNINKDVASGPLPIAPKFPNAMKGTKIQASIYLFQLYRKIRSCMMDMRKAISNGPHKVLWICPILRPVPSSRNKAQVRRFFSSIIFTRRSIKNCWKVSKSQYGRMINTAKARRQRNQAKSLRYGTWTRRYPVLRLRPTVLFNGKWHLYRPH